MSLFFFSNSNFFWGREGGYFSLSSFLDFRCQQWILILFLSTNWSKYMLSFYRLKVCVLTKKPYLVLPQWQIFENKDWLRVHLLLKICFRKIWFNFMTFKRIIKNLASLYIFTSWSRKLMPNSCQILRNSEKVWKILISVVFQCLFTVLLW